MYARANPFRAERIESLPYIFSNGNSLESMIDRLQRYRLRGAIVGPHGSGKTTLLEMLETELKRSGYHTQLLRLREEPGHAANMRFDRWLQSAMPETVLLLDSAGRLTLQQWFQLRRRRPRFHQLIVTQHRRSMLPVLLNTKVTFSVFLYLASVVLEESTSATVGDEYTSVAFSEQASSESSVQLAQHQRLSAAGLQLASAEKSLGDLLESSQQFTSAQRALLQKDRLHRLFKKHRGNLRDCYGELYLLFAQTEFA